MNRSLAVILLLFGGALVWLGAQLLTAGGSAYYLPAGMALIVTSWWLWWQSSNALTSYAALWGVTLVWSLWESGLNGWALAARLGLLSGIGIWLLTPWVRRSLGVGASTRWTKAALSLAAVALVSGTAWLFWNDRITGGTAVAAQAGDAMVDGDWLHYGNAQGGNRHSPLTQINADNVGALAPAWTFALGKEPNGEAAPFEATPLKIGERLYVCSGYNDIVALDAETGKQAWRFAAHANTDGIFGQTCRGLAYYKLPTAAAGSICAERLYTATIDSRLIAVDVATGKACPNFGTDGTVNLLNGMSTAPAGYYHATSPPAVVGGNLVIGGWVTDGQMTGEPSGVIRAFDAESGAFAWAWDMGRPD
ncbi:MAG: hypothetical protein RLZZ58_858, partial [Pseudomonadota bacterium]